MKKNQLNQITKTKIKNFNQHTHLLQLQILIFFQINYLDQSASFSLQVPSPLHVPFPVTTPLLFPPSLLGLRQINGLQLNHEPLLGSLPLWILAGLDGLAVPQVPHALQGRQVYVVAEVAEES